jgi:predicted ATPase
MAEATGLCAKTDVLGIERPVEFALSLDHGWRLGALSAYAERDAAWLDDGQQESERDVAVPPNNLAHPLTSFIGRVEALSSLDELVGAHRLVTVVGAAGAGKTRLALEYLRSREEELLVRRPGGVWMCDLTDARSVDGVCAAVAAAVGVPLARSKTRDEHLALIERALATREPSVLVLDNFEQVLEHAAESVAGWLRGAPGTLFLVTSRSPLGIEGEAVMNLEPLALPTSADPRAEAVELFVERARAVRHGYQPSANDWESIAQIVRRLDGIPLAIELAAARMRVLGVAQIERHLARRFELLRRSGQQRSERQATMRGAIDWSWELLDSYEQSALAQCSVFRNGFDLDAAREVVALGDDGPTVLDVVQTLVERSLLRAYEPPGTSGELRYRLYESVREYAAEKLAEGSAITSTVARHACHYAILARSLTRMVDGRGAKRALDRLALEMENLIAVHQHALASGADGAADRALAVAVALEPLLRARGPLPPLLKLLDSGLALDGSDDRSLVAQAVLARGHALAELGRGDESETERARSRDLAIEAGDCQLEGRALASLARHAWHVGRLADADALYQEALTIHRASGDRAYEGRALSHRANALYMKAEIDGARTLYRQALRLLREHGDPQSEALTLGNLGSLEHDLGRHEEARVLYEDALAILRQVGDRYNEGNYVMNLGTVALERGDHAMARESYEHSLRIQREVGNRRWEGIALAFLALCDELEGHLDDARRHHHAAETLLRDYGHPVIRALAVSWRGRMEADADALEDAQAWLDEGRRIMGDLGDTIVSPVPELCAGHLLLARARAADQSGHSDRAEEHRVAVRALLDRYDPDQVPSADVRLALIRLGDALSEQSERPTLIPPSRRSLSELPTVAEILAISASARAFRVPDAEPVDLSTRRAPRRILAALADQRERYPGLALTLEELLEAGWPGERLLPEAGATRVYTAIATLRRMGLKPFLLRGDDGYLLDPSAPLARMPEG